MAKDLNDLRNTLLQARAEIEAALPAIVEELANSTKVIAERNINEFGFGAEYSTKEVPAFFFYEKALNDKGRAEVKRRSKKKEGLNWSAFREVQGLPNDHVTLNYSNEMWKGILIVKSEKTGSRFISYLGHTNDAGQKKMNWNYERYGNFFIDSLTVRDKDFLSSLAVSEVVDIMKKYFKPK